MITSIKNITSILALMLTACSPRLHRTVFINHVPCDTGHYQMTFGGTSACTGMTVLSIPRYKTFYLKIGTGHTSLKFGHVLLSHNTRIDTFSYVCTGDQVYPDKCYDSIYVLQLRMSDHYFYRKQRSVQLIVDSAIVDVAIDNRQHKKDR